MAWLLITWGVLTVMIGASTFALGVGAAALMSGHGIGRMTAGVITAVLVALAVMAVVWGSVHIIAGVALRRRRLWTRPVIIALGAVDLLLLPYGTALGAYALWVLLSEPGRTAFHHTTTQPHRASER